MNKLLQEFVQLKHKYLHYYMLGFVDGEGSFSVTITRHKSAKWGWIIHPTFLAYQHPNHREVLELFQYVFKTGTIRQKSPTNIGLVYRIDSIPTLKQRILPFFKKYKPLVKSNDFKKFCQVVDALTAKQHRNFLGFKSIIDTAFSMNDQGKQRQNTKLIIYREILEKLNQNNIKGLQKPSETLRRL